MAGGGVYFGCWDYYGNNHTRVANDAADLLGHVDALLDDPALGIDPEQVYIAGLSSGGGMAMVMGCLAPDVFAGVGIDAGPTVGTSSSQIGKVSTTQQAASSLCTSLAGAAEPIRIGSVLSVTGPAAFLGDPELKTLQMYIEDINRKGGVVGRQLQLVHYDDGSDANKANGFAKRLIDDDKVDVLIGGTTTGSTMSMVPLVERAGLPFISLAGAVPNSGSLAALSALRSTSSASFTPIFRPIWYMSRTGFLQFAAGSCAPEIA